MDPFLLAGLLWCRDRCAGMLALMPVVLMRMDASRLATFLVATADHYVAARRATGEDAATAQKAADESLGSSFPGGTPAPGHHVFAIVADGTDVGWLWLGPHPFRPEGSAWWVYDITVDAAHRRNGHASAALRLADDVVRELGGERLGLNVFGNNTGARALYDSLGFSVDSIHMSRTV